MTKNKLLSILVIIFACFINLAATIKIGVYNDKPLVFDDDNGEPCGIYPDILESIAKKENWKIQYIHGCFPDLLEMLENNEIDLMVAITSTKEREKNFKFNSETVFTNWGTIVTRKNNLSIESIKDLDRKKIAVEAKDVHFTNLKKLCKNFNINPQFELYSSYNEVIESFLDGKTDAGLIPRLFFNFDDRYINSLRNTEIIFSPIELKFATNISSKKHILQKLDFYIHKMKENPNSIYYQSVNKWIGNKNVTITKNNTTLVFIVFIVIVLFLVLYIVYIIRHEHKSHKIFSENHSLKKEVDIYKLLPFTTLEELSETGFMALDADYKVKVINKSFSRIFNLEKDKIINRIFFDVITSNNIHKIKSFFNETTKNEKHFERVKVNINHMDKILNITIQFIRNLEGKLLQIFCLVEDLTIPINLKKENELLKTDLQNSLSKINKCFIITDIAGRIIFTNKKFSKTFMFSHIEVEGKEIYPLLFTDEYAIKHKIETNKKNEYRLEITCKTKYSKAIKTKITVHKRIHKDELLGYYFFIEDITMTLKKQHEYEKNLEHMNIVRNTMRNSIIFRKEINKNLTFIFATSFDKRFIGYFLNKNAKKIENVFNQKTEKEKEELLKKTLLQIKSRNNRYTIRYQLQDSNNVPIDVIEIGYAIRDENDRLKYLEGVINVIENFEE